ncbi:DUF2188 domain-containing protein [Geodermatophilus sp. DF01-2]|uniref:DUF2188 domain-containing protein n=1 Tax=Geodermatophilus sp. DF01-2 TaxID=2559610 RepID=UPI0010745E55|nr:DUF2188 domain-containing protein [Geodermatophilus sp. DF01_2]TFV62046.1 DUF2188 domain-containing protein [Geodermatophilus sp. DF01_2]
MARKVYRVLPAGGSWKVAGPSGSALSTHYTKPPAVSAGQAAAKANQPSQLVVHKADGTFEYEYTYGDDPFPPKG